MLQEYTALATFFKDHEFGLKEARPAVGYNYKGAKDTKFPILLYETISNVTSDTKTGASTVDFVRIRLRIFSAQKMEGLQIADLVRRKLDRTQTMTGITVRFDNENDDFDDENNIFVALQDYIFRVARVLDEVEVFTEEFTDTFQ
jgi:hypothetical protein